MKVTYYDVVGTDGQLPPFETVTLRRSRWPVPRRVRSCRASPCAGACAGRSRCGTVFMEPDTVLLLLVALQKTCP